MINNEDELSLSECLKFLEKHADVGNLKELLDYKMRMYSQKYIGSMAARVIMSAQIGSLLYGIYDSDNKKQYSGLRKRVLCWDEVEKVI